MLMADVRAVTLVKMPKARDRDRDRTTDRLLKVAQVAILANLSERTVWRDIQLGRLPAIQTTRRVYRRTRIRLIDAKRYAGLL